MQGTEILCIFFEKSEEKFGSFKKMLYLCIGNKNKHIMNYRVFYITDNDKRFCDKVEANSSKEAENKVKSKYNDIREIVQVMEV